ncbi:symmetrical bis(5'-nucleosyl)-tetraphosphatase [Xylophilus ampelinus]|uniref:Bis(5'-nucleosyl)-tetraphosphatase, symmetrical n=1 Tax=Xylophilus ampelinus TaxID=54067 RepID=A0A318SGS1_9BURK|nr:symmetrical bis(5'-nucleosyl)-tetraphosphatase [Xylophilus ampelinus]MCS4510398.1 symmetrical bis(5'-nucleosyl)-tetraphosphatase [Xylophilus ampelinus]PYE77982.1 bis(5'nucleosyl)-tetraphosphatase ApaH [Xylophilus ampelinus]
MAVFLIGDIQGCDAALGTLMREIGFSPSRDTLYLLGDLVNRGPASAAVVRRAMAGGDAIRCLLGNHDLHLLAVAEGVRKAHRGDTLDNLLTAPDRAALLDWLRHQPLACRLQQGAQDFLLVHAGVLPQWSAPDTMALAAEVEAQLRGADLRGFLSQVFGNTPDAWGDELRGIARLRVIVNALTRLRFCHPDGRMDFEAKEGAARAPEGLLPWFDLPGRRTADQTVAFGHWSTLGWIDRPGLLSLDTGCVWGGCLTAVRLGAIAAEHERIEVECEQAQVPG